MGWDYMKPNQAWKPPQFSVFVLTMLSGINISLKAVAISLLCVKIITLMLIAHLKTPTQVRGKICRVQARF